MNQKEKTIFNSFCINELEEMRRELEEYIKDSKI